MLIDILRMPPTFGIPLSRAVTITTDESYLTRDLSSVFWADIPLYQPQLTVGSNINRIPDQLYKAIHISRDSEHAFETVFSVEEEGIICLYTKTIGGFGNMKIGISLEAICLYQAQPCPILPVAHFLINPEIRADQTFGQGLSLAPIRTNPVENIVPPVFSLTQLWTIMNKIMDVGPEFVDSRIASNYYPLYQHVPHVMDALISGKFTRSPFMEMPEQHSSIEVPHDRWYSYERLTRAAEARGLVIYKNHPAFDVQIFNLMNMNAFKLEVTALISKVIEKPDHFYSAFTQHNSYTLNIAGVQSDRQEAWLTHILYECVMNYCFLQGIDYTVFLNNPFDRSSITVTKNGYDEIEIIFHDLISGQYVCFYSSFPALALGTLSVGRYI